MSAQTPSTGTERVKRGMAEQLKGGVIMDVVTPEQAKIAEDAGAVAVMALERVPADIRAQGGVARTGDPDLVGTATRVGLARRFYNDAVRDTRALRHRRLPRLLRLHARRPLPRFFDIDDGLEQVITDAHDVGEPRR